MDRFPSVRSDFRIPLAPGLLFALLVAGCSDSTGPGEVLSVSLDPSSAQVPLGEFADFQIEVAGSQEGGALEWTCVSSAPSQVAPSTTTFGCRVQGLEPGEANLTANATRGSAAGSAMATVEVLPAPTGPSVIARLPIAGGSHGVIVNGGVAYVRQQIASATLAVVDVRDPAAPELLGTLVTPGAPAGFALSGDRVYLAAQTGGLQVVGVSNPQQPTLLGTFENPPGDGSAAVDVVGTLAYHAAGCFGVRVVEFADPAAPVNVGSLPMPGCVTDILISGDRAYVVGPSASVGISVLDVSNPATPLLLGTLSFDGLRQVASLGPWVIGAGEFDGIRIIDPSDPTAPVVLGSVELPGWTGGIFTAGSFAFVPRNVNGGGAFLDVISVSDPTAPEVVASLPLPGAGWDVWVDGGYAYVAASGLLDVIDLGDALTGVVAP